MANITDVQRYSKAVRRSIDLAKRDILSVYLAVTADGAGAEEVRRAMQAAAQAIVRKYGNVASAAALEYYRGLVEGGADGFEPDMGDLAEYSPYVAESVRWAMGGETPDETAARLSQLTDFYVKRHATDTMVANALRDPMDAYFARVPTGSTTCDFCITLASRGFVYATAKSAGAFNSFHEGCDCQIVASREPGVSGYDSQLYLEVYANKIARDTPDRMSTEARAFYERNTEERKARRRELYAQKRERQKAD